MKKLLLILLCLPMIGFGQFNSIDQFMYNGNPDLLCPANEDQQPYYYPYQDLGMYTHAKLDILISDWVDFVYDPVFTPDSVYVDGSMGTGAFLYGSINYNSNQQLDNFFSHITTMFVPIDVTVDCQYDVSNQVASYSFSVASPLGNDAITDTFFYNGGTLATKTRTRNSAQIWTKDFIWDSSGQLIKINYYTTSSTPHRTDSLTYSNGKLDNVSISDGRKYEYKYNISSGYCETILLYHDNIFTDTVCEYTFVNNKLQDYSLKSYSCSVPPSLELEESYSYTYDSFGRIWTERWYQDDGTLGHILEFFYFSTPSSIDEAASNISSERELLKVTDVLGRETKDTKNKPLFYIYDDGTVEKKLTIE